MRDPVQAPDTIDRYFTEQVVGRHLVVDMGLSATARSQPMQGVMVEWASGKARVSGMAWRSLWTTDPVDAVMGQPLNLPQLARWKRRVLLLALLLWSAALAGGMYAWRH
jgi:hypothetical protein